MIDTVIFSGYINDSNPVIRALKFLKETGYPNEGNSEIKGKLKNLNIKIEGNKKMKSKRLTVVGSLNKFVHSNNIKRMYFKDISLALEELSDTFHFKILGFELFRIDIAANMVMKYSPEIYILNLSKLRNYKKNMYKDFQSIYFNVYDREIHIYNKIAEVKPKSVIPYIIKNNNILRYEFRLRSHVYKQLGLTDLYLKDLLNPDLYRKILDMWESEFFKIIKKPIPFLKIKPDARRITDMFALGGINSIGGLAEAHTHIQELRKEWKLNPVQFKRIVDKLEDIYTNKDFTDSQELIDELDLKVKRSTEFYL